MGEHFDSLCIRVPKVYDWVKREVTQSRTFRTGEISFPTALTSLNTTADVQVVLTDAAGTPIDFHDEDALNDVIEVSPFGRRRHREIVLPDGEVISLQEVRISISGFYRIKIDEFSTSCIGGIPSCELSNEVFPFSTTQTYFLCAPEGTYPVVHLDSLEGTGNLVFNGATFQQLDLDLFICLSVQIEREVKIEVEGSYCYPRPEIIDPVGCGPIVHPPHCDGIFPRKHKHHHHDLESSSEERDEFEFDLD